VSVFVVDASLVVKWFIPEVHAVAAGRWLAAPHEYVAPDLLFPEAGNVIWKKVRRGELSVAQGRQLVSHIARVAVDTVDTRSLFEDAVAVAMAANVTVYDAMYVTLAVRLDTQLITGDDRLVAWLEEHRLLQRHVRRLQDFVD
jgi:predicted nucleic acid-binding protein